MRKRTRWRRSRGTRSPSTRPLLAPQTQQKKHIYRINDSHRTATNRWQKNLNFNNGKKFVILLGKTREKRVREGESEWDGRFRKGTAEEKGIPHPRKSPTVGKIKRTRGISRCREECSSKLEYLKADQELNRPSELRAQSPKIEMPGWGLGTKTSPLKVSPQERARERLGGGWAPRPLLQRLVPGKGLGDAWVGAGHRDLSSEG